MPNYTWNSIKFSKEETLKKYLNDEGYFDFNKVIKMPEALDMTSGSITDQAIVYYMTDKLAKSIDDLSKEEQTELRAMVNNMFRPDFAREIYNGLLNSPSHESDLYDLGKQYVENYRKYGYTTWYGWCCDVWGTKWNAFDQAPYQSGTEVDFTTAWCLPEGIFKEICRQNPNEKIEFSGDYEEGYHYKGENVNGEFILTAWEEPDDFDEDDLDDEE